MRANWFNVQLHVRCWLVNLVSCCHTPVCSTHKYTLQAGRVHSVSRVQECKEGRKYGCGCTGLHHFLPSVCLVRRCWCHLTFDLTVFLSIVGLKTRPGETRMRIVFTLANFMTSGPKIEMA